MGVASGKLEAEPRVMPCCAMLDQTSPWAMWKMFFISPGIVVWICSCSPSATVQAVACWGFSCSDESHKQRGCCLWPCNPENVELVPSGIMKCVRTPFFFPVEKHEIIARLARVIIHLTVKLPLCFTVCYMPFLCASALCILQLTVWKENEVIYQDCSFLPTNFMLFLLLGWYLLHIACGHVEKCKCIKFYYFIVRKRPF